MLDKSIGIRILVGIPILFLALFACKSKEQATMALPEFPVVETIVMDVPIFRDFVGQTYGYKDIAIRARVEGVVQGLHFKEGSEVAEGKLLYTIDPNELLAREAAAQSRVAEARTMLVKAEADLTRIRPLAAQNAVSKSDLDAAVAQRDAAQATLEAAKAQLRYADIELGYSRIYSPISGTIGFTEAKVGDFVGREPNPVVLNAVSRTDTIQVRFSISESEYLQFARRIKVAESSTQPEDNLLLILADGSIHNYKGHFDFINRAIDAGTGTVLIQASFPNPEGLLKPGQYARVRGVAAELKNAILVPQRAVRDLQGQSQVYVVDEGGTVSVRTLEMGPTYKNLWVVNEGLKPGERVIVEGIQKMKSGMQIVPALTTFEIVPAEEATSTVEATPNTTSE